MPSFNPINFVRSAGNRVSTIVYGVACLALLVFGVWEAFRWTAMRVYVGPGECLVVINKFGQPLPPELLVVPKEQYGVYKGVQEEVRGPGRYFLNPVEYDHEIVPVTNIPAGDPTKWVWTADGALADPTVAPMVGLVASKQGRAAAAGTAVVNPGEKGIQRDVLSPGVYKINPHLQDVQLVPAVLVPPGSVGVVTRLYGDVASEAVATLTEIKEAATRPTTVPTDDAPKAEPSRLVSGMNERGILKDVLQPGIYYLNPKLLKVTILPIGYDAITLEHPQSQIRFYSKDGYLVEADFTVVWGRSPSDAPNIVANIGDIDLVRTNVLEPAMKAACQNEGAKYFAKELIQGDTRSAFQDDLSHSLETQVQSRNIHVLLALVRAITIRDGSGKDSTDGLLTTIQRANIEVERGLTNEQKTLTAAKKASLAEATKLVDVARETVASETNVKVANITAEGKKTAAEIDADRELSVAGIDLEISKLEAQRTQILGKAEADVSKLTKDAEAKGAKMLVDAFGSSKAYNEYIFAQNFAPTDLRLIFAGPGTFWTDLKTFQDVGAASVVKKAADGK